MSTCMNRVILFSLTALVLLISCKPNRTERIDPTNVPASIQLERFEQDLFSASPDSLQTLVPELRKKYGRFVDLFSEGIIHIGKTDSPEYCNYLSQFLSDTMVQNAYRLSQQKFQNISSIKVCLNEAFNRFHCYFPDKPVPKIYTFVSGYNLSLAVDDSILAIGLDRYLGSNTVQYKLLGIPRYQVRNMRPEKIPSDAIRAWMYGSFSFHDSTDNLLSNLIYEGQVMYLTKQMLPQESDSLIFGFTPSQHRWCLKNEKAMWTNLIENKLLFSTNTLDINKFINDAPFTSGFPQESPGRAAVWIGYRIVKSLMKNNDTLTLSEMMGISDYQKFLAMSRYKPR